MSDLFPIPVCLIPPVHRCLEHTGIRHKKIIPYHVEMFLMDNLYTWLLMRMWLPTDHIFPLHTGIPDTKRHWVLYMFPIGSLCTFQL